MYIAIDCKPENGCEIREVACGRSGMMLGLKIVKTATEEATLHTEDGRELHGLLHGAKVFKDHVSPWNGSDRMIGTDSCFAPFGAAVELASMKLHFIDVVKTANRIFPMQYLSWQEAWDSDKEW